MKREFLLSCFVFIVIIGCGSREMSFDLQREPEGFRNIKWGTEPKNPKNFIGYTTTGRSFLCSRSSDELTIGGAKVKSIDYTFEDGKLIAVWISYHGSSNHLIILKGVIETYGDPESRKKLENHIPLFGKMTKGECKYYGHGKDLSIYIHYEHTGSQGTLSFNYFPSVERESKKQGQDKIVESVKETEKQIGIQTPFSISIEGLRDLKLKEENLKKLKLLKAKFTFSKDEFKDIGWYTHRNESREEQETIRTPGYPAVTLKKYWFEGSHLATRVNSKGYIYLKSYYWGRDWLFHTRVRVKIGDSVLTSDTIPSYSDDNIRESSGGKVWETIHFTRGRGNGILEAIANNVEKVIKVRFEGDKYYDDMTLSQGDKEAIRDSWELSKLIKTTEE